MSLMTALRIHEGQRLPWWAGIAWWNFARQTAVIMPLGLHWLAGLAHFCWLEFKLGYVGPALLDESEELGALIGRKLGYESGLAYGRHCGDRDGFERGVMWAIRAMLALEKKSADAD